jgi:mycothiol synthase
MTTLSYTPSHELLLPDAPGIAGLIFRNFQGESDFPGMVEINNAANRADEQERVITLEDMTNTYSHLTRCDPYQDVLIAEIDGEMSAYSRVTWYIDQATQDRIYQSFGYVHPEWRRKGLGRAMLHHNQRRLREIAENEALHVSSGTQRYLETFANNFQTANQALIESEGYTPIRWGFKMIRPDLENIPDLPLPAGLEVRQVTADHYRKIWDAAQEAFRDHWGYVEPTEEEYQGWLSSKEFQPELWQVAWDVDYDNGVGTVAGMILNFINYEENELLGQKRGWTESISVRRPWRRRGLARALLARSLKMHRDLGMTEAALGVDADNPNGARQLYESMGFKTVRVSTTYRKPME